MEEEIIKQKYRHLKAEMKDVRQRISNAIDAHNSLFQTLNRSLLVNGSVYQGEQLNNCKTALNQIKLEITSNTIPRINSKL